ncbi:MAG: DNA (cytosine-5)-methyltransferase 1 [Candidatus Promineifilaceae bacterium]|jgi:DNA (cytosine-5)-methyltransferase 1
MKHTEFSTLRQKAGISIDELSILLDRSPRTLHRYEKGETEPIKPILTQLRSFIEEKNMKTPQEESKFKFKFIDLFAGIGGIRRGFEQQGGECVFTSEWDKYAQQTYRANFPNDDHEIAGDITKIHEEDIPSHDVLLAGFPCQPFSIAGVSKKNALGRKHGFLDETQGTLFFDIARIIKHHMPQAFLLENVKNLVNHDKGRTFKVIEKTLMELGYKIDKRVIDAKGYVPQHRERIYLVGFLDHSVEFSFNNIVVKDRFKGPKLSTILHPEDGSEIPEGHFTLGKSATVSDKYTLSNKLWNYLQAYAEKHRKKGNGFGYGLCGENDVARTLSARYYKDGSEILIEQIEKNPRRLTPRECARLMGYQGSLELLIPVSDTQAYKQFGNSVVVPVIEVIAKHMVPWIECEQMEKITTQLDLNLVTEPV